MIVTVDGGTDENPRYEKKAPGRSAFNRLERRMVKLSKELNGVILEHDKFGSHRDAKDVTVDKNLKLKNFEYTGRTLAKSGLAL